MNERCIRKYEGIRISLFLLVDELPVTIKIICTRTKSNDLMSKFLNKHIAVQQENNKNNLSYY